MPIPLSAVFTRDELRDARLSLTATLLEVPRLTREGLHVPGYPHEPWDWTETDVAHVALCTRFLSLCGSTKNPTRQYHSGFIAHMIEALFRIEGGGVTYVTNGALIAAAGGAGRRLERCDNGSPSVFINIPTRDLHRLRTANFGAQPGYEGHPVITLSPLVASAAGALANHNVQKN